MKIRAQHHKAIILLSEGMNNLGVAKVLGIAPETVSRFKSDVNFQTELNKVLEENQKAAQERLKSLAGVALDTIEAIMKDEEAPAKDRLTASLKVIELINLAPQAAAIEITTTVNRDFNSFYNEPLEVLNAIKRKHAGS